MNPIAMKISIPTVGLEPLLLVIIPGPDDPDGVEVDVPETMEVDNVGALAPLADVEPGVLSAAPDGIDDVEACTEIDVEVEAPGALFPCAFGETGGTKVVIEGSVIPLDCPGLSGAVRIFDGLVDAGFCAFGLAVGLLVSWVVVYVVDIVAAPGPSMELLGMFFAGTLVEEIGLEPEDIGPIACEDVVVVERKLTAVVVVPDVDIVVIALAAELDVMKVVVIIDGLAVPLEELLKEDVALDVVVTLEAADTPVLLDTLGVLDISVLADTPEVFSKPEVVEAPEVVLLMVSVDEVLVSLIEELLSELSDVRKLDVVCIADDVLVCDEVVLSQIVM